MGARVDPSLALSTALPSWRLSSNKNHVRYGVIYCWPSIIEQPSPGETPEQLALCGGTVVAEIVFQDICYPLLDFAARRGSDGRGAVSATHAC